MTEIIEKTILFVKETLKGVESGHDWWHIKRVWQMAKRIAETEQCNIFIVEMAALLHDIADSKFHDGDENIGSIKALEFLKTLNVQNEIVEQIIPIIKFVSFKGGNFTVSYKSIELEIVQDADRLDAIGAMGISRAFNYGGFKNRAIYNPEIKPTLNMTKEEYKKSNAPTINHFYEKLLLLKDRMNTEEGRRQAIQRHNFMVQFLEQFYKEWEGIE
ncbi:MAG: HD domain-containing protein [Salinivirgaceae bacterium]|nr:HD domain-containing protein [Salinivirgaceae bacterium]